MSTASSKNAKSMQIMRNSIPLEVPIAFSSLSESTVDIASSYVVCAAYGARCTDAMMSSQFEFLLRVIQLVKAKPDKFIDKNNPITIRVQSIFPNFEEGDLERSGILLLRKSGAIRRQSSSKDILVIRLHVDIMRHINE